MDLKEKEGRGFVDVKREGGKVNREGRGEGRKVAGEGSAVSSSLQRP